MIASYGEWVSDSSEASHKDSPSSSRHLFPLLSGATQQWNDRVLPLRSLVESPEQGEGSEVVLHPVMHLLHVCG